MMTQGFIQGCLNPSCCCLLQACKRAELPDIILRHFHPRSEVPVNHSSAGMLGFRCLKSGCQQGCAPSAGSRSGSSLASSQLLVVTSIPWLAYVLGDLIMVYFELAKLIPTTGPLHRIFSSSGMFFPQHPQEASTTMISISQMRKQKLKEMKLLRVTQLVTAGKGTQTMVVSCYDGASCGFKSYALCRDENDTQLAPRKLTAMHQAGRTEEEHQSLRGFCPPQLGRENTKHRCSALCGVMLRYPCPYCLQAQQPGFQLLASALCCQWHMADFQGILTPWELPSN
ncbi:uncharacterized protein LOC112578702 isoform X1 [Bubalus bubalis]|uniref:uncharacterized protein LOC112578702 isoform X1 n=1 Tax=Bubalus bubalis TaxID=89462 RepID=UPI001D12BFFB|nr:uncharacterized protein LOC112578702 isoform X1 [Bubalus bubalis]